LYSATLISCDDIPDDDYIADDDVGGDIGERETAMSVYDQKASRVLPSPTIRDV
jgi:hypothetical protein